jgi:two-component system chemotaxis sensor kinase CheA
VNSFVEKFKEEVIDYCARLESGLLILEHEPDNQQIIQEIFRILHSMKGSGGMFGFELLSDVTHDLETLFDIFRSNKRQIDSEVISFTLNSLDGIYRILTVSPSLDDQKLAEQMKADTKLQISRFIHEPKSSLPKNLTETDQPVSIGFNQQTWYISFVPHLEILKNGTNPLYLIDELNALGTCNVQVNYDRIPSFSEMNPEYCYISWSIFIATSENIDTLRDVFIFVNDQAEIEIEKVSFQNVLHDEAILAHFLNTKYSKEEWLPIEPELITKEIFQGEKETEVLLKSSDELSKNPIFTQTTVDSVRVNSGKIDIYMNLVSELITAQSRLELIATKQTNPELSTITEVFGKLSRQLRDNAFDMSLIPLDSVAIRFKRLIHDLSKSLDKEIVLLTEGMETELDKNIIEKLIEPLLHIIRNAIDHGIETKTERLNKNKPAHGTVMIKASTAGSYVLIEIEDDGAGLDLMNIRKKALEKGIIQEGEYLSDDEIAQLIFEPGFSTAELVTDVSGRGVGMDVVKKRIQAMRGMIELRSEKDRFTCIAIRLPLSLSIIDGLLTRVGEGYFVIPTSVIRKIHFIRLPSQKKGYSQLVELDGVKLSCLNLHDEFVDDGKTPEEQFAVVVEYNNRFFVLVVDEVVHEYQAVIKPLGKLLNDKNIFSGASILGSGQLALVIDTSKIIKKYL